jgi:hypothetical protein
MGDCVSVLPEELRKLISAVTCGLRRRGNIRSIGRFQIFRPRSNDFAKLIESLLDFIKELIHPCAFQFDFEHGFNSANRRGIARMFFRGDCLPGLANECADESRARHLPEMFEAFAGSGRKTDSTQIHTKKVRLGSSKGQ